MAQKDYFVPYAHLEIEGRLIRDLLESPEIAPIANTVEAIAQIVNKLYKIKLRTNVIEAPELEFLLQDRKDGNSDIKYFDDWNTNGGNRQTLLYITDADNNPYDLTSLRMTIDLGNAQLRNKPTVANTSKKSPTSAEYKIVLLPGKIEYTFNAG